MNKWPGTESQDYGHIYRMTVYRSDIKVESILKQVEHLYAWNYPAYPMDLCFYKDGFAWFWSSSHEGISCFYSDDKIAQELNELGVELQLCKKINKLELYYDPKTIY